MVANSNSTYVYNATLYLRKGTNSANISLATYFVKHFCKPVNRTNRHVTIDNWFTSVPFPSELLQLTIEMKNSETRNVGTSVFDFDSEKMLVKT